MLALVFAWIVLRLRATLPENIAKKADNDTDRLMSWYRAMLTALEASSLRYGNGETPVSFAQRAAEADACDEAFEALDRSLMHFKAFESLCAKDEAAYTAPLLKLVKIDTKKWRFDKTHPHTEAISLANDWPWWSVQEYSLVKDEIRADSRWNEWVSKL